MFVHIVLFWLKDDVPEGTREKMREALEGLSGVETVKHLTVGSPVPSPREVVDGSYDIGLCVLFEDKEGHDAYQVDEAHKAFLEAYKDKWERVVIYDFA